MGGGMGQSTQSSSVSARTARQIQEHTVTAVADTRTNSVIVIAVESVLDQVTTGIENLDKNSSGHMGVHTTRSTTRIRRR